MSNLKKMIRARQQETGEPYAVALRHVRAQAVALPVEPPPPSAIAAAAPPSPPPRELGDFYYDGGHVKQRVLTDGRCELLYRLSPDGETYLGPSLAVMGGGGEPPPGLIQRAKRYAEQHKARLLALLNAARYGSFRADRGGVSAVLQTDVGEVSAWFTRWDDQRPVVRRASATYEVAQWATYSAFLDVPEHVRQRLFRIARPADKQLHAAQHHVIACLRWDSTQWTQSVVQLWQLAQRAGLDASVTDIAEAAQELALLGRITQKTGDSSDCFWLTDTQLTALGGSAVPTWAAA